MKSIVSILAKSPIVHGAFGESAGNTTLLRRMPIVSIDGMPRVPCISGNAIRGVARRIVFRELFERTKLSRETLSDQWDRLYAALANGGHLDGSEKKISPDDLRRIREDIPPLSVFGAALYSRFLPGHANVGIAWPVCRETVEAGIVRKYPEPPNAEDLVDEVSLCRHVDREEHDPDVSGVTPMPTTFEALAVGTRLELSIDFAAHSTEIERGALLYGVSKIATIGGKSASGFGEVVVDTSESKDDIRSYVLWRDEETASGRLRAKLVDLAGTLEKTKKSKKK